MSLTDSIMSNLIKSYHIYNVVQSKLETDIDCFMRVSCGENVVPGGVVSQQVHRELQIEACLVDMKIVIFLSKC